MKGQRRLAPFRTAQTEMPPSLESVIAVVRSHHPNADAALLERAFAEVSVWHAGQRRRSGAPYITHCLAVAAIVADLRMPVPVVCAALLHDVEDTACPPGRLTEQFGEEIAELVTAVSARPSLTAPADVPLATPPSNAGPWWEMTVLAIRLADRLHNMRTIAFVAPPRQHLNARETLDVFAPVARAAGLEAVGRELYDLASAVLQPAQPPYAAARRLLAALALLLPASQRPRWQEEWSGELAAHTTRCARALFTFRVLLCTPGLP